MKRTRFDPRRELALRGYAPAVVVLAVLALLVALVPSKSPMDASTLAATDGAADTSGVESGPRSEEVVSDAIGTDGGTAGVAGGERAAVAPPSGGSTGGKPLGKTAVGQGCPGGKRQTREPYSPPCLTFEGFNGGATSPGVTGDVITVAYRTGALPSVFAVAGQVAEKANIRDTEADIQRTIDAYVEYFNKNFQLYGRQVKVVYYKGQGDQLSEFFGAGGEAANGDALRAAKEIKAFADLSVLTVPYAEALVRQKVIAIPPIHMSRAWHERNAPYAYGVLVDCSRLTETLVQWAAKRLLPYSARYAGDPAFREQKRKMGLIIPEQPWYQECANAGEAKLKQLGFAFTHRINYKLDFSALSSEAANMVAQMKANGVTTVACACDPVLPLFLTTQATQQDYRPEWVLTGTALTDTDLLAQIYDREQWRHAFGISFLNDIFSGVKSESYRAYKAVRTDEPAFIHDILYYPVMSLFLGVHMAGPNLTPETFQAGLFRYPPTRGETGMWKFGPGDWTATDDAREVYFSPDAVSPFNNEPGKWVPTLEGRRFRDDDWPEGEAVFPIQP